MSIPDRLTTPFQLRTDDDILSQLKQLEVPFKPQELILELAERPVPFGDLYIIANFACSGHDVSVNDVLRAIVLGDEATLLQDHLEHAEEDFAAKRATAGVGE